LHQAVIRGDREIVRILLQAGADPDQRDKVGRTAAVLARDHDKEGAIQELKKYKKASI